jgi:hypothetical protein
MGDKPETTTQAPPAAVIEEEPTAFAQKPKLFGKYSYDEA